MPFFLRPTVFFSSIILTGLSLVTGCAGTGQRIVHNLPDPILQRPVKRPPRPMVPMIAAAPVARAQRRPVLPFGLPLGTYPPGGIQDRWHYIVIHHSATARGGAQRFHKGHLAKGWEHGLGYHFVIGNGTDTPNGSIEVGPRWLRQIHGAHCKTPDNRYNDHGIGICLVGDFEHGGRPTFAQQQSLRRLVSFLGRSCNVPLSNIKTHGGVTHRTACPGRFFSLGALKGSLRGLAFR